MLPGNRIRNQSSGAKNRKRKARQDEVIKSQANDMLKYVTRTKSSKTDETSKTEEDKEDEEFVFEEDDEKSEEETARDDADCMNVDKEQFGNENIESQEKANDIRSFREDVDMDDLGNWKKIEQRMRDYLVERGPPTRPPVDYPFPRDGIERCFTYSCYTRRMSNGEKQDRRWLVYSKSKDKLFCFCCKLFTQETYPPLLLTTGYDDWRNASHRLKNHETTYNHIVCMSRWIELEMRLKKSETIDKHLEEAINKEKKHWRDVMLRIIVVVKTLAERNLAFRGENEKVSDPNSGNFLAFIKMIGGFDEVMKEHIRRVDKELLANEIRMVILKKIQEAKYFSIILDTTPDISRKEQMTFLIRCVDVSTDSPKVEEFFLSFLEIKDKTGEEIFTTLQDALADLKLNISDVRGQGYDNGAFYTPCGCHSLNLALCDMASSTEKAVSFFGIVQRLYNLFSSSTNNWEVYREMVHAENSDNLGHRSDAECLAESETHGIGRFEFLFGMVIWYDLLYVVNTVSKSLQSEDMDLEAAIFQLGGLVGYLKGYRETGFEKAKAEAMQIAIDMEIEPTFSSKPKRLIKKKKHYGEDAEKFDDSNQLNAEESFRIDYFINIVDQAIVSLGVRFEQFQRYEEIFGFLFGLKRLKSAKDDELMMSCVKLEASLEHDGHFDVDGKHLFMELQYLRGMLPKEITKAIQISFSKLKLIKNYLRSTMSQERLNGLSMISIEHELAEKLDYSKLINDFAGKKARRVIFHE
ncbi:hypothetical protein N665_0031s0038 [Sinapis alba]|nr:hypothetical protein N665_0031s0038 [Sinapis alba]